MEAVVAVEALDAMVLVGSFAVAEAPVEPEMASFHSSHQLK